MTTPTAPWTAREARENLGALRAELLAHIPRTADWEGEPLTYCVLCTPVEQGHRLEAVKWPCPPLLEAGLTIRDAGMLHAGEYLGRESTRSERHELQRWREILLDLDRCPHGRHSGDQCAGWRGPGEFEGGCRGGYSLGNPALNPGRVIGTNLYASVLYIVPVSRETRHQLDAWKIEITDGKLLDAYADPAELTQTRNALRDANRALYAAGQGPFLPGVGQLDYPTSTGGRVPVTGPLAAAATPAKLTCKCPGLCGDDSPHDAHLLPGTADLLAAEGSNGAQLGLATTRALLIELQARGEVGEHLDLRDTVMALFGRLDGETLDYRTVDSQ